jgi:hypothetical protein
LIVGGRLVATVPPVLLHAAPKNRTIVLFSDYRGSVAIMAKALAGVCCRNDKARDIPKTDHAVG